MKLKYYMRGLGIGIIVTTLIFSLSGYRKPLSDTEIMDRALKLGMVKEQEQSDHSLNEMLNEKKSEDKKDNPTTVPTPTVTPTPGPTATPSPAPTTTPSPEPTKEPTAVPTQSPATQTFTIKKGMSSDKVASLLDQIGLVENAKEFNTYLVKEGLADRIRIGTFEVDSDASYKEIARIITSR